MKRVAVVTRQLTGVDVSASASEVTPEMSQQEFQRRMAAAREVMTGIQQLTKTGAPPNLTLFDLALFAEKDGVLKVQPKEEAAALLDRATAEGNLELLKVLPGPWQSAQTRDDQIRLVQDIFRAVEAGDNVYQYADWQLKYGGRGLSSNIAVPAIARHGIGEESMSFKLVSRVVVSDPEDAARLSHIHVKKEPNFKPALLNGIIATDDNDHWREQRKHLSEAFLPLSSLAAIMPKSLARAKLCAGRLEELAAKSGEVDMSDFLLHEAQAQLQLGLLGAPENVTEELNVRLRAGFMGDPSKADPGAVGGAMQRLSKIADEDGHLALPSDEGPVHGPLWRAVRTSGVDHGTDYGNILLILFAGHDTTGHTMTWLTFELARNPKIQAEVRREVLAFFASLHGADPTYRDLSRLDLLDRCITETLRMWPAVPNGTYRQLQFDDTVKGPEGTPVLLPKGTYVNMTNWSKHRNRELWGDADTFNPHRQWREGEVAKVGCAMAAVTIESERFSPFAHAPRGCLGRNFAQMEMRLIMLHLLRDFSFELAPPNDSLADRELGPTAGLTEFRGINRATMGPLDLERPSDLKPMYAMKLRVVKQPTV